MGASSFDGQRCPPITFTAGEHLNTSTLPPIGPTPSRHGGLLGAYWAYPDGRSAFQWDRVAPPNGPHRIMLPGGKCCRHRLGRHCLCHYRLGCHCFGCILESKAQGSSMPNLAALESSIWRAAILSASICSNCASFCRRWEAAVAASGYCMD